MEKVKDFNKTFKTMQMLAAISILGFITSTVIYIIEYRKVEEYYQQQTYVITSWGTFPASYYDGRKVSRIETQNHVETFVKHMFAHSAETYYEHINYALNLIDEESGKRIYHDFEEGEVLKNYVRSLPIAASFKVVQAYRHEKNPYGLLLTDFDFIAYPRKEAKKP